MTLVVWLHIIVLPHKVFHGIRIFYPYSLWMSSSYMTYLID